MPCNDLISKSSIESIYLDDNLIKKNEVNCHCVDTDTKKSLIHIYDKKDINMLIRPIERTYYRNLLLADKISTGKVVKHDYFILKDEYQNRKVSTVVHPKEIDIYKQYNFHEIHLDAAWDGLVVWKKQLYSFINSQQENLIKIAIHKYLRKVKKMSLKEINEAVSNNIFSIKPSHLKGDSEPEHFKNWVYKEFAGLGLAKMYKDIA